MPPNAKRGVLWSGIGLLLILTYLAWSRENYLLQLRYEQVALDRSLRLASQQREELSRTLDQLRKISNQKKSRLALEKQVSDSRKLGFRGTVVYRTLRDADLKEYILSKILSLYSPEELRNYETALKRIGLLPKDADMKKWTVDLLSEQIVAFYDFDDRTLYTLDPPPLGDPMQRMILAHELVHALQDQNFGLHRLPLREKTNDDAALAATALAEGDACYHMREYLTEEDLEKDDGRADSLQRERGDRLLSAPPYLRESLIFPYREGLQFVAQLHARSGNEGLDAAYSSPPQSTEQILHPEKYFGPEKDSPKPAGFVIQQEASWKKLHENVVGELGIRTFFIELYGSEKAAEVAAGWGGDRYELFEMGPDRQVLIWKTVWDTPKDAREFFAALENFYRGRYANPNSEKKSLPVDERKPNEPIADSVFFSVSDQKQNITIQGKTVWFLDAPDIQTMKKLLPELGSK